MVDVDHHHLGGAPRRTARLDGGGGAVADAQETHQARGPPAARQRFLRAAQAREIGSRARAILEQARLAHPQVHDAAFVDQVVVDALDKAGMGLGMLIARRRSHQLAASVVHVMMALGRPVDAVGPVKPGVEPLRRVGGRRLGAEHVAHLVEIGPGVGLGIKIAALPAPIGPGAGQPVEHLADAAFANVAFVGRKQGQGLVVAGLAPQPFRHVFLFHRFQARRYAGLAEILLGQDVAGYLRPMVGDLDIVGAEDDGAVRVFDFADSLAELKRLIGRDVLLGEIACDPHVVPPYGARQLNKFLWDRDPPRPRDPTTHRPQTQQIVDTINCAFVTK